MILDPKLNFTLNLKRDLEGFYSILRLQKDFYKEYGLGPRIVLWMYAAVVHPMLINDYDVWLNRVEESNLARQSCPADT